MHETAAFQREVAERLRELLNERQCVEEVKSPWVTFRGSGRRIYSPQVDIAVGPFAIQNQYEENYDRMVNSFSQLLDRWIAGFKKNWFQYMREVNSVEDFYSPSSYRDFIGASANRNSRCFIAIEIENENSKKHLMGSIVNAGALGRIGLVVAWQDKVLRAAIRMRAYFDFLKKVEKRTFDMTGVLVITKNQLV
ncbi:MAG: hypothetical protein V1771_00545 [Chloroflexota bacterium]